MKNVASIASVFLAAASIAIAQPKIEIVGGDTHDWGKVKGKDSPLKTIVKIKNVGNEILKITEVRPGCGCTKTADLDKKELKPGEIGSTEISLDLGSSNGQLTKSVAISSNDPKNATKTLLLKATIIRDINLEPTSYFAFKDMVVGKVAKASLFMQNNSQEDIIINNASALNGVTLNVKKGTVLKKGAKLEIIASVTPKAKGYYSTSCKIETSNPAFPVMEITAYGTARDINEPQTSAVNPSAPPPVLANSTPAPTTAPGQKMPPQPAQDLKVSPSGVLMFSNLKIGKKSTAQITMENTSSKNVVIENISTTNGLSLNIKKGTVFKPGEKKTIIGTITPTSKGSLNAIAQVRAENSAANVLLISVGDVNK